MQAIIDLEARRPVLPSFPPYGICILESRHTGEFKMPPSRYDFFEVMLVLEGNGWIVQGKIRHPLKRRDLMVVPAGNSYFIEDEPQTPLAILCLCLRPPPAQKAMWKPVLPEKLGLRRNAQLTAELASHLRAILFEQSQPSVSTEAMVVAHTLLLLSKLRRKAPAAKSLPTTGTRDVELFAHVQDYINQLAGSFHESETLEAVAARLGISPRSLTTHFRSITGKSRLQYIQNLRLEYACRLLRESAQSVTSISFACGFEDISTFFRAFRLAKKMSPSQWRSRYPEKKTSLTQSPFTQSMKRMKKF